jgi:acetyl esterase/lipase
MDATDKISARPDFLILLYPVISMQDGLGHQPSRTNLIGKDPSPELINAYSADQQITEKAPPTFIVLAEDDSTVPPANGIRYHDALKKLGVPSVLHVFKEGGHGFGIRDARQLPVSIWPELAADWLKARGYIQ